MSKAKEILAYLSNHRGEVLDTGEGAAAVNASPKTVRNVVDMNPGACRALGYGIEIEVFPEDVDMRSTTSDVREARRAVSQRVRPRGRSRISERNIRSRDH